ncbi:transcription antitermination factor NusB [Elusimicrobiota bacterium]
MGVRRDGREAALQLLYLCDNCHIDGNDALMLLNAFELQKASIQFAEKLFKGAWDKKDLLDKIITASTDNWDIARMAIVDRNILRIAAFEIVDMHETPINVVIDEAVEIAKRFSTSDSSKFVNGVLDKLKSERKKSLI